MTEKFSRDSGDSVVEPAPRVMLVDDHQMVAETLQAVLSRHGLDVTVSACASAEGILDEARTLQPTLVVLDLELGPVGHGFDLIRPLVALGADVLVVSGLTDRLAPPAASKPALSASRERPALRRRPGVHPAGGRRSRRSLRSPSGRRPSPSSTCQRRQEQARLAPFETLTARERDVLGMIVEGQQAAAIAKRSYVSLATVRTQIRSIFMKLGVNSQVAAVAMARQLRLVRPEVGVTA